MKTVKQVPETPHERPWTIVQSTHEKYLSTKFHHFCAKFFSPLRILSGRILDTVTTKFDETGASLKYYIILPGKILLAKINLPLQRNRKTKIEKLM